MLIVSAMGMRCMCMVDGARSVTVMRVKLCGCHVSGMTAMPDVLVVIRGRYGSWRPRAFVGLAVVMMTVLVLHGRLVRDDQ